MQRRVTQLPLSELWDDQGPLTSACRRDLKTAEIRNLLKSGPVQFIVADCGESLRWIPPDECYLFWKSEVQNHVADETSVHLDDLPSGYCYWASEWEPVSGMPIILLSKCH